MAEWVVISGSPYSEGKCESSAKQLSYSMDKAAGETVTRLFTVSNMDVHGCIGCEKCRATGKCIYSDDMDDLFKALDQADGAIVTSPIYFAGVPSQFKAVLDRFQPYFWKRQYLLQEGKDLPEKRPLYVYLTGEGGDPYGPNHAYVNIASPFALANFKVHNRKELINCSSDTMLDAMLNDLLPWVEVQDTSEED